VELVVQTLQIMDQTVIHLYFQLSHLLVVEVVEVVQVELVNLEVQVVVEQGLVLIIKLDVEILLQVILLKDNLEEQVDQVNLLLEVVEVVLLKLG